MGNTNFQYNEECIETYPQNTTLNEKTNICEDTNITNCAISTSDFNIVLDNFNERKNELLTKNYAYKYSYTDNHSSQFFSDEYLVTLYKNNECI